MSNIVYCSRLFWPTVKEKPSDSDLISHQLMLRSGLIRQTASGIYAWLPLGLRVLNKIARIIIDEQDKTGACQMLMPTIQSADLWIQSGRFDAYGPEMLRIQDRHHHSMLYSPTNEEMIASIVRDNITSYRQCPQILYQIQWKFRDEIRPRFGVMRGREFLMKDAYSFDLSIDDALMSYKKIFVSYLRIFSRLGLKPIPSRADSGPIGGEYSHEFIIHTNVGESKIYLDQTLLEKEIPNSIDYNDQEEIQHIFNQWTSFYSSTEDVHDLNCFLRTPTADRKEILGLEVGHAFFFGDKYSRALGVTVDDMHGEKTLLQMGSYGIGVSRLVASIIEIFHDEKGICWPKAIAPFDISLIAVSSESDLITETSHWIMQQCLKYQFDILYDDRAISFGAKWADHDLLGCPFQVILGEKNLKFDLIEVKKRSTGDLFTIPKDQLFNYLNKEKEDV